MKRGISKLIVIITILGIFFLFLKGYLYEKEIEDNKEQTVCKYVFCKSFPKTTESFFKYNIKNKWFRNSYGECPDSSNIRINKFFVLYYSSRDPDKIEVDFSKEITDTTAILKAGFSREDIERK